MTKSIRVSVAIFVVAFALDGAFHQVSGLVCSGSVAVTSCSQTCSANCYLPNDLNCTTGQGLALASSVKLDVCGHTIHCITPNGCGAKPAVAMSNGSQVINGGGPGGFEGPWFPAINCYDVTSTKVIGIRFENIGGYAVVNCAKVEQNVFINGGLAAVLTDGVANTDQIDNNYFQGNGQAGIYVYGDPFKITIDHNMFVTNNGDGIFVPSAAHSFVVNNNVFLGSLSNPNPINDSTGYGTYTSNYCDPENISCANCVSLGQCTPANVPFSMP